MHHHLVGMGVDIKNKDALRNAARFEEKTKDGGKFSYKGILLERREAQKRKTPKQKYEMRIIGEEPYKDKPSKNTP